MQSLNARGRWVKITEQNGGDPVVGVALLLMKKANR